MSNLPLGHCCPQGPPREMLVVKQKAWAPCILSSSLLFASVHTQHPRVRPFGSQPSLTRGAFSDTAPLSSTSALLLVLGRQSTRKGLRFTKEQRKFCGYFRGDSTHISMVTSICTKEFLSLCYVQNFEEPEHVRVAIALRDLQFNPLTLQMEKLRPIGGRALETQQQDLRPFLSLLPILFFLHTSLYPAASCAHVQAHPCVC